MNNIIIQSWYGRFGNNLIQLINAITYGLQNNYNRIIFPNHQFLITNNIIIDINIHNKKENYIASDEYDFFFLAINNKIKYTYNIKYLFDNFIKHIINIDNSEYTTNYDLTLYFRSGDIFEGSYNHEYVQPPMSFYDEIIKKENTKNILLVSEVLNNPVIKYYSDFYKWNKNSIEEDIKILINSKVICIVNSFFSIIVMLLSKKIERFYVPDYVYKRFLDTIKINLYDLISDKQEIIIINQIDDYYENGSKNLKNNDIKFMLDLE